MKVEQLVRFAILMENGQGIVDKSPDYILEKFEVSQTLSDIELLKGGLDMANRAKFERWLNKWMRKGRR